MKKYVVCMLYNSIDQQPSCVAHFETAGEAIAYAQLSHINNPKYRYAVYAAFCVAE